jgi:inhibitor of KinA sporulation pathway (predicted exonuclease)
MSIESGNFIILDTEFTSWKDSQENNWSKKGEFKELVQIAAIKIINFRIVDQINILVKPILNPKLSKYFTNLTGIQNRTINEFGIQCDEALDLLYTFCNKMKVYSYGNDYDIIKYNLNLYHIEKKKYYFWENKFYDVRTFFEKHDIDTSKYSSGTIYKITGKNQKNESVHNALWDVTSIFLAIKCLLEID